MSLKERREKLGLTQQVVAQRANVAKSTYCNIENGARNPSTSVAMSIAGVLGCKWYEIIEECRHENDAGQ